MSGNVALWMLCGWREEFTGGEGGSGGILSRAFTNAKQTRHYVEAIQVEKIQPILNVLDFCSQGTEGK